MTEEDVDLALPDQPSEIVLLGQVQQMLVEAKTLPDFRRVMAAAGAAVDTARRYKKLLEAQKMAGETVAATNRAANELAGVHIEAQAGAGRVIQEMKASGEVADRPGNPQFTGRRGIREVTGAKSDTTAEDNAKRWEKIADIPPEVRSTYVRQAQDAGSEVTTRGLLRFAQEPLRPPDSVRSRYKYPTTKQVSQVASRHWSMDR